MKLLLTNDDGIFAPGIYALCKELEKEHEIVISAPSEQKSASGHGITIQRPMIIREVKIKGLKSKAFSVVGTPADCVRVAIERLIEDPVDMVISGINKGVNLGTDVIYSGTVSAAVEAAVYKVPSIAISVEVTNHIERYEAAAQYAAEILKIAHKQHIQGDLVLNVNVPAVDVEEIKGIKVCPMGQRKYKHVLVETLDEEGQIHLEIQGEPIDSEEMDTDAYCMKQGYVTITPLHYDLTNFKILQDVNTWYTK